MGVFRRVVVLVIAFQWSGFALHCYPAGFTGDASGLAGISASRISMGSPFI
jgi:hypothetical protein